MGIIRFKINYEVKQKRKFEDFLDRYQTKIGFPFQGLKIERYWKIEEQFQADFFIETSSFDKEQQVYEILTLANRLYESGYSNWIFNGPFYNEVLSFECILNNTNDNQPLRWAHLELENEV